MNIDYVALLNQYKFKNDPKNRWKTAVVIFIMVLGISLLVAVVLSITDPELGQQINSFINRNFNLILIGLGFFLVLLLANVANKSAEDVKRIKLYEEKLAEYKKHADPIISSVKSLARVVIDKKMINGDWHDENFEFFYWQTKDEINFFPCPPIDYLVARIHGISKRKDQVKFYELVGEKFYENKISGGGSEGPNVAGAFIGGQIMGTAGAIVGGQQKINPIESELILHDTRKTRIVFLDDEGVNELLCGSTFYDILKSHLPEKSKEIFEELVKQQVVYKTVKTNGQDINAKFALLQQLLKDGHITKEEYDLKKQKLIDEV